MKIFKILAVALVAMLGFTACDKECGHDFIEYDHSKDLVGTWTCLTADYAEALVINADGSVVSYGVEDGEYWEGVKGNIKTVNNKMTMTFEDDDNWEGRFEMLTGEAFIIYEENGESFTFNYCKEDLADEIVGMWVCTDGPQDIENEVIIRTYNDNGKVTTTGVYTGEDEANPILGSESNYTVIGDLVFKEFPKDIADKTGITHNAERLIYTPKATALGDIMTILFYLPVGDNYVESRSSYLRIKQHLELPGESYDYSNIYVTNVKATDAEFEFAGQTLNLANMDGKFLDKMMKNLLFNVSFPSKDEIVYNYHYNGETVPMPSPIVVDGNKMTIKKSVNNPACKDIDVWTFQDQDNTQMHMYMPTYAFENFLANTIVEMMSNEGKLDLSNTEKVAEIYAAVTEAIETINVSFIFKTAK